jgi:hypothetical protein
MDRDFLRHSQVGLLVTGVVQALGVKGEPGEIQEGLGIMVTSLAPRVARMLKAVIPVSVVTGVALEVVVEDRDALSLLEV